MKPRTFWVSLVGLALLASCTPRNDIPTYRVEARPFEHRVTAEGGLRAVSTTKLTVPPDVQTTVRLAWLADEGARVEEGDVVARFDPKAIEQRLEDSRADHRTADLRMEKALFDASIIQVADESGAILDDGSRVAGAANALERQLGT